MTRSIAALLVATATLSATPLVARADTEEPADPAQEARQQYQAGMQAYQAKRFVEAALHFEAAVIQRPHAVALYTAALAWERANRPERAVDHFGRALDVPGLSAPQSQNAHDRLATLERTMGTLEVIAPEGWRVQLDANTQVPTPAHLHAMPGVHGLSAQPPSSGGVIQHQDVSLELGKTAHVELTVAPKPPEPAAAVPTPVPSVEPPVAPAPPTQVPLRKMVGVGVFGAGVASVAAALILGVNATSARDAFNAAPTQAGYDHASSLQTWTNVSLVAGGVFLAGGAVLYFWPSPKKSPDGAPARSGTLTVAPTLTGLLVRGEF